jgi:hypothetical protein
LRELVRTAYDIECGARGENTPYPDDTVRVENRQVQQEGCTRGLEKGTWRAGARVFCSLENTGISIATLYHFWQHLGQAVEMSSIGKVSCTGEASNGGHVESGDVAPGVKALVVIGNSKIATYGAAVQRYSGNRQKVLEAIVDGELYISYWELALGEHDLDFVLQNPKAAAKKREKQAAALAPAEPQAETPAAAAIETTVLAPTAAALAAALPMELAVQFGHHKEECSNLGAVPSPVLPESELVPTICLDELSAEDEKLVHNKLVGA